MVIIVGKHGQLCNRLFHASAFLANATEHNYCVYNARFNEYFAYFEENNKQNSAHSAMRFIFSRQHFLHNLGRRSLGFMMRLSIKFKIKRLPFVEFIEIFELAPPSVFDLNDPIFVQKAQSKIVFVAGWLFRDSLNFEKHQDVIRDFWRPNQSIMEAVNKIMTTNRAQFNIVIGVHIRRGDYADFQEGKWFFSDAIYADKLLKIKQLAEFDNKKIGFVICSNERIDVQAFEGLNIEFEVRHFMEDLCILSACDYIVGVPSTFSMWASFYGQRPLLQIMDRHQDIRFDDFKPCHSLD